MNSAHERALTIVYYDHNSSYSELLMTKNKRTIHQQNINDDPSLSTFEEKIKSWYCDNCPCRVCNANLGFL